MRAPERSVEKTKLPLAASKFWVRMDVIAEVVVPFVTGPVKVVEAALVRKERREAVEVELSKLDR